MMEAFSYVRPTKINNCCVVELFWNYNSILTKPNKQWSDDRGITEHKTNRNAMCAEKRLLTFVAGRSWIACVIMSRAKPVVSNLNATEVFKRRILSGSFVGRRMFVPSSNLWSKYRLN